VNKEAHDYSRMLYAVVMWTSFFCLESIIYRLRNTLNGNRPSWSFDPEPAQPPSCGPIYPRPADNELSWVSASQPGSSHIFNEPIESEPPELNIFGEHKTTEQTKVLSKSDVYFVSWGQPEVQGTLSTEAVLRAGS
jgi:hypothetical protein